MSDGLRPLDLLPGLGPTTASWLKEVAIMNEADLKALGAVAAYLRLKRWNPVLVNLNALWALHGALNGVPVDQIDAATKSRLLAEVYRS
jgi:DNA transformation protein